MSRKGLASTFLVAAALLVATMPAVAKNARRLTVSRAAMLNGTPIPPGVYKVSYQTHSPEATVTFSTPKGGNVVATAEGRVVKRKTPYLYNAVIYDTNPDGSLSIIEVQFAGQKQVVVFSKAGAE
jgi:hypothetical protein